MRKLRDLIAELRPAALDDLGLGPAIESLAKRQAAIGGFAVDVDDRPRIRAATGSRHRDRDLPDRPGGAHATRSSTPRAEHVSLRVRQLSDRVQLAVDDDGRGFDPDGVRAGFGLTGMRERALLAGGRLWVNSADGGPTSVTAVLPLPHVAHPAGVNKLWPAGRSRWRAWRDSRPRPRPRLTRTNVPSQKSSVSHFVPSTVAAEYRPTVRNWPDPLAHRRRSTLCGGLPVRHELTARPPCMR